MAQIGSFMRKPTNANHVLLAFLSISIVLMLKIDTAKTRADDSSSSNLTSTLVAQVAQDSYGISMVHIPSGTFQMGVARQTLEQLCANEFKEKDPKTCADLFDESQSILSVQTRKINGFWIDLYEVTVKDYATCTVPGPNKNCEAVDTYLNPEYIPFMDDPQKPQVGVTWYDAMLFCNKRRARLPTEEEWEYAAKGRENLSFPWGNKFIKEYVTAPNKSSTTNSTYHVGSIPQNRSWAGVYDMAGNVSEWVEDRYQPYGTPPTNWIQDNISRVIRGGSWEDDSSKMTTFSRDRNVPEVISTRIGFRCARSDDPTAQ